MYRILIADASRVFAASLEKQLNPEFTVKVYHNGKKLLHRIREFEPDIIFMDLMLPECDTVGVLHTLRTSGNTAQIVTISPAVSVTVQQILAGIGVTYIFPRPCAVGNVVCFLRQLASGAADLSLWCPETEIHNILLRMGFQCGRSRYDCTFHAIRLKCYGQAGDSAKFLYSEVRRICGKKTMESVEKAIRDAINHAWTHGDRDVWLMYFPLCGVEGCPSNEVFVSRVSHAVQNLERMKKNQGFDQPEYKFG